MCIFTTSLDRTSICFIAETLVHLLHVYAPNFPASESQTYKASAVLILDSIQRINTSK